MKTEKQQQIARIVSAYKLSRKEIAMIMEKVRPLRHYLIENVVDPKIYGGFIIYYGTKVIDCSLANQLKNFRNIFYEIS